MTASELKRQYELNNPNGHFFDRKTMRFFGDTMANYGVESAMAHDPETAELIPVWSLYRKRPVKCGLIGARCFTQDGFRLLPGRCPV